MKQIKTLKIKTINKIKDYENEVNAKIKEVQDELNDQEKLEKLSVLETMDKLSYKCFLDGVLQGVSAALAIVHIYENDLENEKVEGGVQ